MMTSIFQWKTTLIQTEVVVCVSNGGFRLQWSEEWSVWYHNDITCCSVMLYASTHCRKLDSNVSSQGSCKHRMSTFIVNSSLTNGCEKTLGAGIACWIESVERLMNFSIQFDWNAQTHIRCMFGRTKCGQPHPWWWYWAIQPSNWHRKHQDNRYRNWSVDIM